MTCAAATYSGITAFDRGGFAPAGRRRAIARGAAIGFGTVSAAGMLGSTVTVAAAWIIGLTLGGAPHLKAHSPLALETAALSRPNGGLVGTVIAGLTPALVDVAKLRRWEGGKAARLDAGEVAAAASASADVTGALPLAPDRSSARADAAPIQARVASPPTRPALQQVADADPSSMVSFSLLQKELFSERGSSGSAKPLQPVVSAPFPAAASPPRASVPQASKISPGLPGPDSRTALYDIEAHTVYLPSGLKLEAHSGLGARLDDPRYVKEKDRGPTPPNVYDLVLRGEPFHGVRAIRLNPVDDGKMFGRDGILAHTYMLGPSGQSFGCVSFKDYAAFLKAFERGEIDRLVVVPHRETRTADNTRAGG